MAKKQYYFMYAGHRYEIVKRGFPSAKAADEYSHKHYGGFAQYKTLANGDVVLGMRR